MEGKNESQPCLQLTAWLSSSFHIIKSQFPLCKMREWMISESSSSSHSLHYEPKSIPLSDLMPRPWHQTDLGSNPSALLVWSWAGNLTSLSIHTFICKIEKMVLSTLKVVVEIQWHDICTVFSVLVNKCEQLLHLPAPPPSSRTKVWGPVRLLLF